MVLIVILSGIALSLMVPLLQRYFARDPGWLLAVLPALMVAYFASYIPEISSGHSVHSTVNWFPSLGIHFSFLLDGLSLTFSLIITFIGTLILIYGSGYLKDHPKQGRFYAVLLIFMASMLGLVLSDNLITLFIFWELTSITSYLLIGFNHEQERSRYVALQALLVTGGGGLAMLAGFIFIGSVAGTFSIYELMQDPSVLHGSGYFTPIAILLLAGAFTKSAQFPFHFWLPNAMAAPTPVSAYLHSATMVKAGVYLIARFNPLMTEWPFWSLLLLCFGGATMVFGGIWAIGQKDLKRILAYTTVSALGTLVFLIGLDNPAAYLAFGVFLVVHALYKGGLFLVAGAIDHSTGTRDITRLKGLFITFPVLGVAAALSALSNAGIPPFLGFLGKEGIYVATVSESMNPALWGSLAFLANACLVTTAFMVAYKPFTGKNTPADLHLHAPGAKLTWPPMLLGIMSLLAGIFAYLPEKWFFSSMFTAVSGGAYNITLDHFSGDTFILMLSLITIAVGIGVYLLAPWKGIYNRTLDWLGKAGAERGYDIGIQALISTAGFNARTLQSESLRQYMTWILCTVLFLVLYTMYFFGFTIPKVVWDDIYVYDVLLGALIMVAAMLAIWIGNLLSAIIALGVVGYGIAIIFVFFGAPDLALTQFSIESLTIVIFILVASRLPSFRRISSIAARTRDKLLALLTGGTMTLLVLMILEYPKVGSISEFFLTQSYPAAKGRNVVNVILVDFRALDTLGEIVVLAIAAIGIYTMLNLKIEEEKEGLL